MTTTNSQIASGSDTVAENRCRSCGSFVTRDFARVFGNNENEVFGCLECMTATEVKKGGARAEIVDTSKPVGGREPIR
ncbi:hypothetical protein [Haladaptatus sp. DYF46]|uniref:DUF7563 family protein n=1 Tax=unclassified Haladaptatus TaxID=2622732 RepID=UPI001E467629|nr:hypothetical protein [Haladaptatus sp. DYF46]